MRVRAFAASVVALSFLLGISLLLYTRYIDDDAFITFRYARQLADGNGFVYNLGERVYGTTTPLFAILLAGWLRISGNDLPIVAEIIDLAAALGALILLWLALRRTGASPAQQVAALVIVGMSPRLWYMNTQGMETPLVLLLMVSSWYAITVERYLLAGFVAGLLLWARIDSALWLLALFPTLRGSRASAVPRFALAAGITYLPWVVFATLYFGSPIPHTVAAKWVAYIASSGTPFLSHIATIARYLSPVDLSASTEWLAPLFSSITIALASFSAIRAAKHPSLLALPAFIVLTAVSLALARATFFNRYFVPILWATLVLAGLTLGSTWEMVTKSVKPIRIIASILLVALVATIALITKVSAAEARDAQLGRNTASLRAIGLWLGTHTAVNATVLVEPLGYIGYYSNRRMIDAVGLVTPRVVDLKRQHVNANEYALQMHPDYVVVHCDDRAEAAALSRVPESKGSPAYSQVALFDPLSFNANSLGDQAVSGLSRAACYAVWQRSLP